MRKKQKETKLRLFSRWISMILIMVLLTEEALGSGTIVLAAEQTEMVWDAKGEAASESGEDAPTKETSDEAEEISVLFEMEEKRDLSGKHYRLSDGTIMAAEYGMDVHYQNEDGQWADIDNRFLYEAASEADAMEGYATAEGNVEFKFATDAGDGQIVKISEGEHTVGFELLAGAVTGQERAETLLEEEVLVPEAAGTELSVSESAVQIASAPITFLKGEVLNPEEVPETVDTAALSESISTYAAAADAVSLAEETPWVEIGDAAENAAENNAEADAGTSTGTNAEAAAANALMEQTTLDHVVTSVGYSSVLPGISLQYVASGSSLKEYILVEEPQEAYQYTFKMELEGLVPQMQEDGRILLVDPADAAAVYEIPAGYMEDAAGAYSDAVEMSLLETEAGEWLLTVAADQEWIDAKERVFPVRIDPTLNKKLFTTTDIHGNYTCQGEPDASTLDYGEMYVGYDSSGNKNMITYIQLRNLPSLPEDSVICAAMFNMVVTFFDDLAWPKIQVLAKEVISETTWGSKYTWNSHPESAATVFDYRTVTKSMLGEYVGWNITDLVKRHYEEGNIKDDIFAFSLEADGEMKNSKCANTALSLVYSNAKPALQIFYRDTRGIEDYYTCQVQDLGYAGTGYVGDYNSQLTIAKSAVSYDSTILPYELGLVYNSSNATSYFTAGDDLHTKDFTTMRSGLGWKLTAQETVVPVSIQDMDTTTEYLVYNDADGTEHYFKQKEKDSLVYEDEDGLNLTITKSGSNYTMKDKKDNERYFTSGYLTKIKDANGNQIHIVYNWGTHTSNTVINGSNQITSIVSEPKGGSAQTIFSLSYDENSCLSQITDAFGRIYKYAYFKSGKGYQLVTVSRYDSNSSTETAEAQYCYDPSTYGMTHAYDVQSGTGVQYEYEKSSTGHRICAFHEYAAESAGGEQTVGASVKSAAAELRKTSYTDAGADRTFGTADDITTTYLFNSSGQTINAMSEDAQGALLGVTASAYEKNSGTSKKNNRMSSSISSGQAGAGYVINGGFERYTDTTAEGWTHDITGGNVACRSTAPHSGNMHYNLFNQGITGSTSIAREAGLRGGTTYTFSAYVNSSEVAQWGENGGAYLAVTDPAGAALAKGTVLSHVTSTGVDGGWQRIHVTFTTGGAGDYRIALVWENVWGILKADDLQLELGEAASGFNHIHNGSFEALGSGWTVSSTTAATTAEVKQWNAALAMTGGPEVSAYAEYVIPLNKSSDTTFLLSGWGKGNAVPDLEKEIAGKTDTALRFWGMTVTLSYTDGTKDYYDLPFSDYVREWQYAAMAVAPKSSGKTISTATLRLCYQAGANTVYFDGISFVEEPAQTYKYDDDGNLVSVKSSGNGDEGYSYDKTTQNLLSVATEGSGKYEYKYEHTTNKHLPTSIINDTVTMGITYDGNGQTTQTTLTNSTDAWQMTSSASYADGLLTSAADNTGASTSYSYDGRRRIQSVTDAGGQTIYTGYEDLWDRPYQNYQSGVVSLSYAYADGNLSQITRGGYLPDGTTRLAQTYGFAYDAFGNRTGVSVGSRVLAEYAYHSGNGNLARMYYGGSTAPLAEVSYGYDLLDRASEVTYHDGNTGEETVYGYRYASDGNLSGVTVNGALAYTYEYDSLGRLIHSSAIEDGETVLYTDHVYDSSDRILSQNWQTGGDGFTESYVYNEKDGTLTSMTTGGDTLSFSYDSLKRLDTRTSPLLKVDYGYRNIDDTKTTTQVESISYLDPGTGAAVLPKLSYTYNEEGHIISVTPEGGTASEYTYDVQDQLTWEKEGVREALYTYDTYGNIRSIRRLENGAAKGTYTLSYDDSGDWKDLLTEVAYTDENGESVSGTLTYDAIGNPLSYFNGQKNWSFTWRYGRQLAAATDGTNTISNTYDVDGIRSSKTVNGVEHKYVTLDGMIVRETFGNVTIDYLYDNEGKPYKLLVDENGTVYTGYYVLNQQGDVIAILDADGNVAVRYTYDAWGRVLDIETTGASGVKLSGYNALMYRGYYYDAETGFYYVSSRYYDPVIGRFISEDTTDVLTISPTSLTDKNLYAYCDNSPVNRIDEMGEMWKSALILSQGGTLLTTSAAIVETFGNTVMAAVGAVTPAGWAVIGAITVTAVVIYVAPKVVNYVTSKTVRKATGKKAAGKKATDSSNNERHGDGGRAMEKAQNQVAKLREQQAKAKTGKEKNEIQNKIRHILQNAQKKAKGENHSQKAKR